MLRMIQRLDQIPMLAISGGATDSIFPKIDSMLEETFFQKALEFVAAKKHMDRYNSMVDFLFCEIWIEFQPSCMKFYKGAGPKLKEMISEEARQRFEWWMVGALKLALDRQKGNVTGTWTEYRDAVLKLAA